MSKNLELVDLLRETILFICEKILIQHQYCFQSVDKLFQDVKNNKQLFGGLPIIIDSDFA